MADTRSGLVEQPLEPQNPIQQSIQRMRDRSVAEGAKKPARGKRVGDMLLDSWGKPLAERMDGFTSKGQRLLSIEIPDDITPDQRQQILAKVGEVLPRFTSEEWRAKHAPPPATGPQPKDELSRDIPVAGRAFMQFGTAANNALASPGKKPISLMVNDAIMRAQGMDQESIDSMAPVPPPSGAAEQVSHFIGSAVGVGLEMALMTELPFLKPVEGASRGAQFTRGGVALGTALAAAPAERAKDRAISGAVGFATGGAAAIIAPEVAGAVMARSQGAARSVAQSALADAEAANAVAGGALGDAAEQQFANEFSTFLRGRAASKAQQIPGILKSGATNAQRAATAAGAAGSALLFGPVSSLSEYYLHKVTGDDVEMPSLTDMATSTAEMLALGLVHGAVENRFKGKPGGAGSSSSAEPVGATQIGPGAASQHEAPIGPQLRPKQPRPPAQAIVVKTWDEKAKASIVAAEKEVQKAHGAAPLQTFGGMTPVDTFRTLFNSELQQASTAAGVSVENLAPEQVREAAASARRKVAGIAFIDRTMTLPPADPADPDAVRKLNWRAAATKHANDLMAGREVEISMPVPGRSMEKVGLATIVRVEMDPSMKSQGIRVLVRDAEDGRLIPMAFDSPQHLADTFAFQQSYGTGDGGRLTTSRLATVPKGPEQPGPLGEELAASALGKYSDAKPPMPGLDELTASDPTDPEVVWAHAAGIGNRLARSAAAIASARGKASLPGRMTPDAAAVEEAHAALVAAREYGVKVTDEQVVSMLNDAGKGAKSTADKITRFGMALRKLVLDHAHGRIRALEQDRLSRHAEASAEVDRVFGRGEERPGDDEEPPGLPAVMGSPSQPPGAPAGGAATPSAGKPAETKPVTHYPSKSRGKDVPIDSMTAQHLQNAEALQPAGPVKDALRAELKKRGLKPKEAPRESKQPAPKNAGQPGVAGPGNVDGRPDGGRVRRSTVTAPAVGEGGERVVVSRADLTAAADESAVPEGLAQHLTPYQRQGVALAVRSMDDRARGGFLLADGTGVGKTRQILAVAEKYRRDGKHVVIFVPNEVIGKPWEGKNIRANAGLAVMSGSYAKDAEAMGLKVQLWRPKDGPMPTSGITVTTYTYITDHAIPEDRNAVYVFDESHNLKNATSSWSRRGRTLINKAHAVLFASATPADKPMHIEYLARIGILEGKTLERAVESLGLRLYNSPQYGPKWVPMPGVKLETILERMAELFDRMTKNGSMVKREISLKGVDIGFRRIAMSPETQEKLKRIDAAFPHRATALMHARRQQEPDKIPAAMEIAKAEIAEGRRVIFFVSRVNASEALANRIDANGEQVKEFIAGSRGTAELLAEELKKAGLSFVELHGNADEHAASSVARFQSGDADAMVATIESGGTGINLDDTVGDSPRTIIFLTAPFNGVSNVQAVGRAWRLTTKSFPRVVYLFGDTEVDKWNAAIIARKMQMLGASVSGEVKKINIDPDMISEADAENVGELGGLSDDDIGDAPAVLEPEPDPEPDPAAPEPAPTKAASPKGGDSPEEKELRAIAHDMLTLIHLENDVYQGFKQLAGDAEELRAKVVASIDDFAEKYEMEPSAVEDEIHRYLDTEADLEDEAGNKKYTRPVPFDAGVAPKGFRAIRDDIDGWLRRQTTRVHEGRGGETISDEQGSEGASPVAPESPSVPDEEEVETPEQRDAVLQQARGEVAGMVEALRELHRAIIRGGMKTKKLNEARSEYTRLYSDIQDRIEAIRSEYGDDEATPLYEEFGIEDPTEDDNSERESVLARASEADLAARRTHITEAEEAEFDSLKKKAKKTKAEWAREKDLALKVYAAREAGKKAYEEIAFPEDVVRGRIRTEAIEETGNMPSPDEVEARVEEEMAEGGVREWTEQDSIDALPFWDESTRNAPYYEPREESEEMARLRAAAMEADFAHHRWKIGKTNEAGGHPFHQEHYDAHEALALQWMREEIASGKSRKDVVAAFKGSGGEFAFGYGFPVAKLYDKAAKSLEAAKPAAPAPANKYGPRSITLAGNEMATTDEMIAAHRWLDEGPTPGEASEMVEHIEALFQGPRRRRASAFTDALRGLQRRASVLAEEDTGDESAVEIAQSVAPDLVEGDGQLSLGGLGAPVMPGAIKANGDDADVVARMGADVKSFEQAFRDALDARETPAEAVVTASRISGSAPPADFDAERTADAHRREALERAGQSDMFGGGAMLGERGDAGGVVAASEKSVSDVTGKAAEVVDEGIFENADVPVEDIAFHQGFQNRSTEGNSDSADFSKLREAELEALVTPDNVKLHYESAGGFNEKLTTENPPVVWRDAQGYLGRPGQLWMLSGHHRAFMWKQNRAGKPMPVKIVSSSLDYAVRLANLSNRKDITNTHSELARMAYRESVAGRSYADIAKSLKLKNASEAERLVQFAHVDSDLRSRWFPSGAEGINFDPRYASAIGAFVMKHPDVFTKAVQAQFLRSLRSPSGDVMSLGKLDDVVRGWLRDVVSKLPEQQRDEILSSGTMVSPTDYVHAAGNLIDHLRSEQDHAVGTMKSLVESYLRGSLPDSAFPKKMTAAAIQKMMVDHAALLPDHARATLSDVLARMKEVSEVRAEAERRIQAASANSWESSVQDMANKLGEVAKYVNDALGKVARRAPLGGGFGAMQPVFEWLLHRAAAGAKRASERFARRAGKKATHIYVEVNGKRVAKYKLSTDPAAHGHETQVETPPNIYWEDPASESAIYRHVGVNKYAPIGDFAVMPPKVRQAMMKARVGLDANGFMFEEHFVQTLGERWLKDVRMFEPNAALASAAVETLVAPPRWLADGSANPAFQEYEKKNTPEVQEFKKKYAKELEADARFIRNLYDMVAAECRRYGVKPPGWLPNYFSHIIRGTIEWDVSDLTKLLYDREPSDEEKRELRRRFFDQREGDQNYEHDYWVSRLAYIRFCAAFMSKLPLIHEAKLYLGSLEARIDPVSAEAVKAAAERWLFPRDGTFSQMMNNWTRTKFFTRTGGGVDPISASDVLRYTGMEASQLVAHPKFKEAGARKIRFAFVHADHGVIFTDPAKWEKLKDVTGGAIYIGTGGHAYGDASLVMKPWLQSVMSRATMLKLKLRAMSGEPIDIVKAVAERRRALHKLEQFARRSGTAIASTIGHRLAAAYVGLSTATTIINLSGLMTHVATEYGLRSMAAGLSRMRDVSDKAKFRVMLDYCYHHGKIDKATFERLKEAAPYSRDEIAIKAGGFHQGFAHTLDTALSSLETGQHEVDILLARYLTNWMGAAEVFIRGWSALAAFDAAERKGHTWLDMPDVVSSNQDALVRYTLQMQDQLMDARTPIGFASQSEYLTNFYYDRTGQFSGMQDAWFKTFLGMFSTFPVGSLVHRELRGLVGTAHVGAAAVNKLFGRAPSERKMEASRNALTYKASRRAPSEPYGAAGGKGDPFGRYGKWFSEGGASHFDRQAAKSFMRLMAVMGIFTVSSAATHLNFFTGYAPFTALAIVGLISAMFPDSEELKKTFARMERGLVYRAGQVGGSPVSNAIDEWRLNRGGWDDAAKAALRSPLDQARATALYMSYRPVRGILQTWPEQLNKPENRWAYDLYGVRSAYYGLSMQQKAVHAMGWPDLDPDVLEKARRTIRPRSEGAAHSPFGSGAPRPPRAAGPPKPGGRR